METLRYMARPSPPTCFWHTYTSQRWQGLERVVIGDWDLKTAQFDRTASPRQQGQLAYVQETSLVLKQDCTSSLKPTYMLELFGLNSGLSFRRKQKCVIFRSSQFLCCYLWCPLTQTYISPDSIINKSRVNMGAEARTPVPIAVHLLYGERKRKNNNKLNN